MYFCWQIIRHMSRLICLCKGVREEVIIKTINSVDQASLEVIQTQTGAGTNCGRCINSIESILSQQTTSK